MGQMTERLRVLGMMSGTSMDGIETALIETDGESLIAFGPHESFTFDHQSRELLMAAKASARSVGGSSERTAVMTEAEALETWKYLDVGEIEEELPAAEPFR